MTALLTEPRLSLNALARREGVHISTVWRWCLRGCKGHKLESFNVGGKKFTTLPAYERWVAKINAGTAFNGESFKQREASIRHAERELDQLGA